MNNKGTYTNDWALVQELKLLQKEIDIANSERSNPFICTEDDLIKDVIMYEKIETNQQRIKEIIESL